MRIYVVRHGQSTHNANQDVPHNPDPPLTALGREQAERTGAALRDADLGAVALYASPQRRALETVAAVQTTLGLAAHIFPDLCEAGGLREHPGMCREQILTEWPGVTVDERVTKTGWWTGGLADDEDFAFFDRAKAALSFLCERHVGSEDTIVVVTHGRFGSALISTMLDHVPVDYSRYPFNNCGISRLDFEPYEDVTYGRAPSPDADPTRPAVRLMFHNQTKHLPQVMRT